MSVPDDDQTDPLDELFPIRRDAAAPSRPGRLELPRQYRVKRAPRRLWPPAVDRSADDWATADEPVGTPVGTTSDEPVDVPAEADPWVDASRRPTPHVVGTGVASAVLAVVLRVALAHVVASRYLHLLNGRDLLLGGLVVLVVTSVLSRLGVGLAVCLAVAVALATADVAAPVGVVLVVAAVAVTKRR